jgi:hypothetical protein
MSVLTIHFERLPVLKQALLIYKDQVYRREQFVTLHEVMRETAAPQQSRLGPGRLLTTAFLKAVVIET